ncbi:MAG: OmpA family protein [Alphaproteobacteria bacterium]|nr:OmpA family protein [Alphaproteobacteria bacterium]
MAQDDAHGFDAHGFSLVAHDADVRDGLVLQRPGTMRGGSFFAGGVLSYAKAPLVLQDPDTKEREIVLDHVLAANVSLGGALHERLRLDALVPLFLTSTGPAGGQGVGLGDIRLSALAMALIPEDTRGWGLGLVPWVELPTGVDSEFLGQRAVAGGVLAAGTHEWDRVTATVNVGGRFTPRTVMRNLENADAVVAGVGGAFSVTPDVGVGLEVRGDLPIVKADVPGTGSPWEAVGSVRHVRPNGAFLSGGAAMALTTGAGAATFRLFLGGGFGAHIDDFGPRDRDGDGIVNRDDACPDEPETVNDYRDADGCPDHLPALAITVREGDAVASGASLDVATDGAPVFAEVVSEPTTVEVRPGAVELHATRGPCLAGSMSLEASEDRAVDLPLQPVKDALLQIAVRTPTGDLVPDAKVVLTPSEESCLADPVVLEGGRHAGYVGPTTWSITVTAPGHHPFETGVMMVPGGDESVVALLTPQVKLEKVRIEETGIVLLEQVFFDTGRATLRPGSSAVLDEVVAALQSLPSRGVVEVQGHTDNVGSDTLNEKLSQARAETVRKYLVDHGIPADRLRAKGYGEAQPKTTNRTPEGRQANRRVEFVFVEAP